MSDTFVAVNGVRATGAAVSIPEVGVWVATVDFDAVVVLSGAVVVTVGALTLRGTVHPALSGTFGAKTRLYVAGGGRGWQRELPPKHFHNDAGVKVSTVGLQTAAQAGEVLELGAGVDRRLAADYGRQRGPARRVLADLFGAWRVDYDGVTRVGARTSREVAVAYEVLGFDPRAKVATLSVDDPTAIGVGSVLRARLDRPLSVRALELDVEPKGRFRAVCWGKEAA